MVNELIRAEGLGLELETELAEIEDDGSGRACAVHTKRGQRIECQIVGLTAGVSPNVSLAERSGIETGRGILVDDSLRTGTPDVFAAGDCAEIRRPEGERNLLQQVWYTGKHQAEVAADVMAGEERSYDPGIWYNSAKFFDLEYMVYGRVNMNVPGEENLYWEDPSRRHSLRLVHVDGRLIGVNTMGLRWRHEVCERWIREERSLDHVLEHMEEAHFEPELYRRFEPDMRRAFRQEAIR